MPQDQARDGTCIVNHSRTFHEVRSYDSVAIYTSDVFWLRATAQHRERTDTSRRSGMYRASGNFCTFQSCTARVSARHGVDLHRDSRRCFLPPHRCFLLRFQSSNPRPPLLHHRSSRYFVGVVASSSCRWGVSTLNVSFVRFREDSA